LVSQEMEFHRRARTLRIPRADPLGNPLMRLARTFPVCCRYSLLAEVHVERDVHGLERELKQVIAARFRDQIVQVRRVPGAAILTRDIEDYLTLLFSRIDRRQLSNERLYLQPEHSESIERSVAQSQQQRERLAHLADIWVGYEDATARAPTDADESIALEEPQRFPAPRP
jgi:hypothetical protein